MSVTFACVRRGVTPVSDMGVRECQLVWPRFSRDKTSILGHLEETNHPRLLFDGRPLPPRPLLNHRHVIVLCHNKMGELCKAVSCFEAPYVWRASREASKQSIQGMIYKRWKSFLEVGWKVPDLWDVQMGITRVACSSPLITSDVEFLAVKGGRGGVA